MIEDDAKAAQGVISLIPGIGTGISAAISVGVGILDGGGALDIAIEAAYGAIPIPAGIRQITDAVLGAILELIHHPHNLTDALLAGARNAVPAGMARDVFDTLANLVVKKMPIQKAAGQLVDSYVARYAPGVPIQGIGSAAASVADAAIHHRNVGAAVSDAVGGMARKALPGALGEGLAGAAHVVGAAAQGKNIAGALGDAVGDAARKVAPGALGEGLSAAAHVAGAAAQGKNVAGALGAVVGDAARKLAPGALGEGLSAAARVAGAAAQGKNVAGALGAAVGDAARKVAPGALGDGLATAAQVAGAAASGRPPLLAASSALMKYLPGGVTSAARQLGPGPGGIVGTGVALASGAANVAHGGNPLGAITDAARQLGPAPASGGVVGTGLALASSAAAAAAPGGNAAVAVGDAAKTAAGLISPLLRLPPGPLAALVRS